MFLYTFFIKGKLLLLLLFFTSSSLAAVSASLASSPSYSISDHLCPPTSPPTTTPLSRVFFEAAFIYISARFSLLLSEPTFKRHVFPFPIDREFPAPSY